MSTSTQARYADPQLTNRDGAEMRHETWKHWPVNWTAIWVGALTALTIGLILGLVGIALGAHLLDPENRVVDLKKLSLTTLALSVFASFLSFAAGGWVSGKIAGILRAEPGMLHGAVTWLVAVPILVLMSVLGAGSLLGGWYAGLSGNPSWSSATAVPYERPEAPSANASQSEQAQFSTSQAEYREKVKQWREDTPRVTRNSALCALTALLLGLIGAVIGGWFASGEPMTFTHHRTRSPRM